MKLAKLGNSNVIYSVNLIGSSDVIIENLGFLSVNRLGLGNVIIENNVVIEKVKIIGGIK